MASPAVPLNKPWKAAARVGTVAAVAENAAFTGETNVQEALERGPWVEAAFRRLGLKCVDRREEMCVAAGVETLADAARYHQVPLEKILDELNRGNPS